MRTSLVGALLGARVGLSNIPSRFLEGLDDADYLVDLAEQVARAAVSRNSPEDVWFWPNQSETNFTIGAPGSHHKIIQHIGEKNSAMTQGNMMPSSVGWTPAKHSVDMPLGVLLLFGLGGLAVLVWRRQTGQRTGPRDQYTTISE